MKKYYVKNENHNQLLYVQVYKGQAKVSKTVFLLYLQV